MNPMRPDRLMAWHHLWSVNRKHEHERGGRGLDVFSEICFHLKLAFLHVHSFGDHDISLIKELIWHWLAFMNRESERTTMG